METINHPEEERKESEVETSRLTEWAKEPTVAELKQDYTDAKSDVDEHIAKVDVWLDNLNVTGAAKRKKTKKRSAIVPKLIRKQAEWRYASLSEPFLSTEDIFNADPITFEDKKAAIQNGLVLNNQFNTKINKIAFIDEYVRTAVDEGTVIVRVGWDFQEAEVEVPSFVMQPVQDPQVFEQLQQEIMKSQEMGVPLTPEVDEAIQISMQTGVPHIPVQQGTHMELKTIKNCPTVEVCDYKSMSIDPLCKGDISKAGFVIYDFETSLAELQKASKYHNLDQINFEENNILAAPDHEEESDFNFKDKPRKKFVAHEYWGYRDIDGNGMVKPIVATYVGNTMIRLEENPFPDQEHPFVTVQYLPVRKSVYGEPDGELLEDNQQIIGAVTRGMIDIMARSANGQTGIRKDALDLTNKRKYDKGEDYEFNAQVDPRQAFFMHTFPEIPRSAEFMLGMQNAEAESMSGVKAFTGNEGINGRALGATATGIKSALDATSKRELGILRRLAEGIKKIGRKVVSMNGEFLDEEEVIRITNDEFVKVRRDDLEGNFDLRLTISTAEADNQKAEELAFMLQTTGQTMGPEFAQIILSDIAKLRKMPDLAKRIEQYQPQPDPIEQQMKMLEMEKIKAEIAKLYSDAKENEAEAVLDMAKAGTEQARTANLTSDTDLKNLDFVEQESGVTQERELQQHGAQAEANKDLKVLDHMLKANEKPPAAKV